MIRALESTLNSLGPDATSYINTLVSNTNVQEQAEESGDPCALAEILDKGAQDTAAGAYHTISNPALYELTSEVAPNALATLADEVEDGTADGKDVNNLVGYFGKEVKEATQQPM